MNPTWQTIWNKRTFDLSHPPALPDLLAADGYDSPFAGVKHPSIWRDFVDRSAATLGLRAGDTVFEVGCGAGAFLYPLHERGHQVAGMDYAGGMLDLARLAMPGGQFEAGEAASLPAMPQFDAVVACGVFLYFTDADYGATVLKRMVSKARRCVAVLDVPDRARQAEAVRYRIDTIGREEYEKNYRGLDHQYYERAWFAETLADPSLRIRVADQSIEDYGNAPYRFNVFIHKG